MEVDKQLVEKIGKLAKLEFDDTSKAAIQQDLNKMLKFVDKLNEMDTEGVEPLLFISEEANVLREDKVDHTITKEQALKNAPLKDSDYIKVPKVINKTFGE